MIEKLLNAHEVAQVLGVSKSFVYQLLKRGEIPSLKMGKAVRVRPQDLDRFVSYGVTSGSDSGFHSFSNL